MIDFLKSFKSLIKLEDVHTDNNVFKLHYKFTVILLVVFSVLLSSKQYFGDPINCHVQSSEISIEVIQTYCWIYGTFVYSRTSSNGDQRIGQFKKPSWMTRLEHGENDKVINQKYYQWVCIIFCLQALSFYFGKYFWKIWEGGRLGLLVRDLCGPYVTSNWTVTSKEKLVKYLIDTKYSHNVYAVRYTVCEIINFVNVCLQIYLMDCFLNGQFLTYGVSQNLYAMDEVFPKMAKCTYFKFGASGSQESRDALCLLPLNILNEKFFLILWFWFFSLSVISLMALIYRSSVLFVSRVRMYLLMAQCRSINYQQGKTIINNLTYGDFFLLYLIGKNVNPVIYNELVLAIYEHVYTGRRRSHKPPSYMENI